MLNSTETKVIKISSVINNPFGIDNNVKLYIKIQPLICFMCQA